MGTGSVNSAVAMVDGHGGERGNTDYEGGNCNGGAEGSILRTSKRKLIAAWVILLSSITAGGWHLMLIGIELASGTPAS